jgi:hypothetical protein
VLTPVAANGLAAGAVLHPLGDLAVRQTVVPLALTIRRFANLPVPPQEWTLRSAELRPGVTADLGEVITDVFPAAQFLDLGEEDRLARPAFEPFIAGVRLAPEGVQVAPPRLVDTGYETKLVGGPSASVPFDSGVYQFEIATRDDTAAWSLWAEPAVPRSVTVEPAQPLAAATTGTLAMAEDLTAMAAGLAIGPSTAAEMIAGLLDATHVQLVERWEVLGA